MPLDPMFSHPHPKCPDRNGMTTVALRDKVVVFGGGVFGKEVGVGGKVTV